MMFDPATHGREMVNDKLAQQRSRRFELDLIPEPTRTDQNVETQIEKCDAEIARLETIAAEFPSEPTDDEQIEAAAQALAKQIKIEQRAQEIVNTQK